jgi:hypothetical protein
LTLIVLVKNMHELILAMAAAWVYIVAPKLVAILSLIIGESTLIFSFSSIGEDRGAFVMGCKSPFATP